MHRAAIIASIVIITANGALAQLAGTYTIDKSRPTGGSNFATFQDAAFALTLQGITGPVTFRAVPGFAGYAGFEIPGPIRGSDSANVIHFLGTGGYVAINAPAPVTSRHGIGLGPLNSPYPVMGSGPSHIIIENIEINGIISASAFYAAGCSNITIRNVRVVNCGGGIGFSSSPDSVVEDCKIRGAGSMTGSGTQGGSYSGGVYVALRSHRSLIQRNRIHDCPRNGIYVGSTLGQQPLIQARVVNNFIWNCGTQAASTPGSGIVLDGALNATVANNSIWMPAASSGPALLLKSTAVPLEVSNNLVRHSGSGMAILIDINTGIPVTLDHNVYDLAGTGPFGALHSVTSPDLQNWQLATGQEGNSLVGDAMFASASDLHIDPTSAAFNRGSAVQGVLVDIDGTSRPIAATPDVGADETEAIGLFAGFTADVLSGEVPFTVAFDDHSFSSDPGGILSYSWDVNGDGITDYTTQRPSHTYVCPGSIDVTLTVTDGIHPPNTRTRVGYIAADRTRFTLTSTGSGDLTIQPVPAYCFPGVVSGFTLASLSTGGPIGGGPFGGLYPDTLTFTFLAMPPAINNIIHFQVSGSAYPNFGTLTLPPGTMMGLSGQTLDAVQVLLDSAGFFVDISNVSRVTF